MKVAELFAQLSIKVDPNDLSTLKEFEKTLNGIAAAAKSAASALRRFSRVTGGQITKAAAGAPAAAGAAGTTTPPTLLANVLAQTGAVNQQLAAIQTGPAQPSQGNTTTFATSFGRVFGMTLLKTLGFVSLAAAAKKLANSFLDITRTSMVGARNLDQFNRQTGMSREAIKRYEYIGALVGMQAQEVQDIFQNLRQTFERIRETGEGAPLFTRLGISLTDSPEKMMRDFMAATSKMDESQAKFFATLLGIPDTFIYAMRKFGDQMLPKNLLATDEQQTALVNLNTQWNTLVANFRLLSERLIGEVAPALTQIIKIADDFVNLVPKMRSPTAVALTSMSPLALPTFLAMKATGGLGQQTTNVTTNITATGSTDELSRIVERATSKAVLQSASGAYFQSSSSQLPPLQYTAVP
jgi:hypothetical protein